MLGGRMLVMKKLCFINRFLRFARASKIGMMNWFDEKQFGGVIIPVRNRSMFQFYLCRNSDFVVAHGFINFA